LLLTVVNLPVAGSDPAPSPKFTDWSVPVSLGPPVNSAFQDTGPAISKKGLSLYFGSNRPGGSGGIDLWVSTRPSVDEAWSTPANLGPQVNSGSADNVPALSRDEHWLFFNSDRPGGLGDSDIWVSWRSNVHDDFGWQPPVNLGATINTAQFDAGPCFFENDEAGAPLLFFGSGNDIYVSTQAADGSFGPAELIAEVSSPAIDARPHVRADGREMILQSDRPGTLGTLDLWASTRDSVFDRWSQPVNVGPVINGASRDFQAYLSSDGETLYFSSDRPGGLGAQDLYYSTRTRARP
jgi:Tol biopolymer transport system component